MKEKDLNSIIVEDQELEVIIQPNDKLTSRMENIIGGNGLPGDGGPSGLPGDGCQQKNKCSNGASLEVIKE